MKNTKKTDKKSIVLALVYFFRQGAGLLSIPFKGLNRATLGGNLDPTYLLGLYYIKDILKQQKKRKEFLICLSPILFIVLFQLISLTPTNVPKFIVTFIKLVLCVLILLFVKNYSKKINLYHFSIAYTVVAGVFTIISLLARNTIMWRYNDYVNSFDLTRLQLFYLEPSELGFHISIIILILLCLFLSDKYKKYKYKILGMILANVFILYLSKALGATVILFGTVTLLLIYAVATSPNKKNIAALIIFAIISIGAIVALVANDSSLVERISSVASGTDGSVNYRLNVSFDVLGRSMSDYGPFGVGLGNVNTDAFISRYANFGLDQMIVNSFVYFWVETGAIGFIFWMVFMLYLFYRCADKRDKLAFALLLFVFLYQFVGGHYTSGLSWIVYGYVLSKGKFDES